MGNIDLDFRKLDDTHYKMLQFHNESEIIQEMSNFYTFTPTQIVMYATRFCPDCIRAKKFFDTNNIPYLHVGLEGNEEATEFVKQINHGNRSVPTIIFPDGSILVEPSWNELEQKFK